MDIKEIKAVVFDMDGVLLDTETICDKTWDIAAKEIGLDEPTEAKKKCLGTNKNDTALILNEIYGKDFDSAAFMERTGELFREIEEKNGIGKMFWAKESLEALKEKYRIALASSTREKTVRRQLKDAGLLEFFETITTGDMVEHSKPAPDIYLKACASLDLSPENCLAVEDSPNGIKSAKDAGMKTVMIPDRIEPDEKTKKLCDAVFKNLKEMTENL